MCVLSPPLALGELGALLGGGGGGGLGALAGLGGGMGGLGGGMGGGMGGGGGGGTWLLSIYRPCLNIQISHPYVCK